MKKKYEVTGMMCAACQAHVEKAVSKLDGVSFCNVSLLGKNMVVDFDESKQNDDTIIRAVENAGYGAKIFVNESVKEIQRKRKLALRKQRNSLLLSIAFLVVLMIFSMGPMIPFFMEKIDQLATSDRNLYYFINVFFVAMQFVCLIPIVIIHRDRYVSGIKSLLSKNPNMDALVALGSIASVVFGIYAFVRLIVAVSMDNPAEVMDYSMKLYIESAAMIPVFIGIGKYLEAKATEKTTASIASLMALTPETALLVKNEETIEVPTDSLKEGDLVLVKPGASVPTDGFVVSGVSSLNESAITGESTPIEKKVGDKVIGATVNLDGAFTYKVGETGKDSTIGKIISLVEEASNSKAPIARLADKIASVFVPAVLILSLLVFGAWLLLTGLGAVARETKPDFDLSFQLAITVMVISCPCALGLATPVAIMVGTGKGAENGILIKSAVAFENLVKTDTILFDKTGTLTTGEMEVKAFEVLQGEEEEVLSKAASLESLSSHPLSKAIVEYAKSKNVSIQPINGFMNVPGRGVKSDDLIIGNEAFMKEEGVSLKDLEEPVSSYSEQGMTVLFVSDKKEVLGLFAIGDTLKENAVIAIKKLHSAGKSVYMVTGDNKKTAQAIANQLELDSVYAETLPDQKQAILSSLQQEGHLVAMVGDGINDAPALTQANVGIAIGAGTDVAIESSDIILMRNDPLDVVSAVELAARVKRTIKQNLAWAFFYNALLIPIAAGAFYGLSVTPNWFTGNQEHLVLTPMIASMAMSLSSVTVVLNALRLRLFKPKQEKE